MAVYGITLYGTETYGYFIPPVYRVDPFTAVPSTYSQIMVNWNKPAGTILGFRLIKNMFGAPVDQDDGEILIDSTAGYVGNSFADNDIVPGAYHYYGFYVLINNVTDEWVRSGLTGVLMPKDYGSSQFMHGLIPNFFIDAINGKNELVLDPIGNTFLDQFIRVTGWGIDYLRTQYDTYLNVNDPWKVPLNDLYTLAAQLNLNINPDIHPYTLRKAVYFNAEVNKFRGTTHGIATELSALTGWNADITVGPNIMLNNDQSYFADPSFPVWSANLAYNVNEMVAFGNFWYKCLSIGNQGHAPTGTSSSNTWWQAQLNVLDNTFLLNTATGYPSTWEILYPLLSNGQPAVNSLKEAIGTSDPLNPSVFAFNSLTGSNLHGSATDIWLRSVARTTIDMATVTTSFAPDKYQAIADGLPLPFLGFNEQWDPAVEYATQDVVIYSNQPFVALRASKNVTPPYATAGASSQDWAPLSFDGRFRICTSTYETASSAVTVTPFVEWYDAGGNFIMRLFARNPVGGAVNVPNQLCYDSFVTGAGNQINARTTDDTSNTWTQRVNSFSVSPFAGGCVYPTTKSSRSVATVNAGAANCQVGVTFVTTATAGQSHGLILRYSDDNNYLRAGRTTLRLKSGGVFSTLGTYSTPCVDGDRMMVQLNGSTITVLRNNVQVLQVTNSFNSGSTIHGIINEAT